MNGHASRGDMAAKGVDAYPACGGIPQGPGKDRVGFFIGLEGLHLRHLNDKHHMSAIALLPGANQLL